MPITLTFTFNTEAEAVAFLTRDAVKPAPATVVEKPAEKPAPKAKPQPETPAPAAASPAPAAPAASPASSTEPAASLDYEKDVKPLVVKLGATKGREAVLAVFEKLGVAKGPELKPEQLAAAAEAFNAALGA